VSDFLYTSEKKSSGLLSGSIKDIYLEECPEVIEFHGDWGSLAVSRNLYNGFQPFENEKHLVVVIGGPVLTFRDNRFLNGDDPVAGTVSLYQRYISGTIKWDEDISGPFVVFIVNKSSKIIQCITDLMLSIPVYHFISQKLVALGTHVDAFAKITGQKDELDFISVSDFILNNVITHPYTTYNNIRQCTPATALSFSLRAGRLPDIRQIVYWEPFEITTFKSVNDAAKRLKEAVSGYIHQVTESLDKVALLISGGEDARAVAGLMPYHLKKDSYIFLDHMNRQGRIARKVASAYNMSFTVILRNKNYYLDILPEATSLIGSGQQYTHAHTIGLYKESKLPEYQAIFGGYMANALLKASDARKSTMQQKMSFLFERVTKKENHSQPLKNDCLDNKVLALIDQRRQRLISKLEEYRSDSVHEWFLNWPRTMGPASPTISVNRRLFRSYEPFLSNDVIKIAAAVPVDWKCNRILFHKAMKPAFKRSKHIPHSKGWFPYYCWWANIPIRITVGLYRRIGNKTGFIKGQQGSWGNKTSTINSDLGKTMFEKYSSIHKKVPWSKVISHCDLALLTTQQKYNLLQVLYYFKKNRNYSE